MNTDPKDPLHICNGCGCELPEDYPDVYCEDCQEEIENAMQEEEDNEEA